MVFCLALAACGGVGDDQADRPQPTTTAVSTTTTTDPNAADEAALRQLAEDWFEEVRRVYFEGRDATELADYAVDPYLGGVLDQIEAFRASGNEGRPGGATRHEVVSVDLQGSTAVLVECVIDADELRSPDGAVLNDTVQANLYETTAVLSEGNWRLSGRRTLEEVDGSDVCPGQ